jgi:hypothetical protein
MGLACGNGGTGPVERLLEQARRHGRGHLPPPGLYEGDMRLCRGRHIISAKDDGLREAFIAKDVSDADVLDFLTEDLRQR